LECGLELKVDRSGGCRKGDPDDVLLELDLVDLGDVLTDEHVAEVLGDEVSKPVPFFGVDLFVGVEGLRGGDVDVLSARPRTVVDTEMDLEEGGDARKEER
jgi:hypothetical protein